MKYLQILLKTIVFITVFSFSLSAFSQYSISGYLKTDETYKTIYLAVLRFDEENAQYENQIITSVKTDSTGYFEIKGRLLSKHDKFYRIFANISETSFDFIRNPDRKNYHNFIFSNNDTIYFPENHNALWFENSENTNLVDKEWKKINKFENNLIKEFEKIKNPKVLSQSKKIYLHRMKTFIKDSVTAPLIKLLAYPKIKKQLDKLEEDFNENPKFYYNILSLLKKEYGETSYYTQFREEIGFLSYKQTKKKYVLHRNINYVLLFFILILILLLFKTILSKKKIIKKQAEPVHFALTQQEKKIIDLMMKGYSNKEIASSLFISLSTVKTHITNIYSKLKVSNRQQLIEKTKNHTRD